MITKMNVQVSQNELDAAIASIDYSWTKMSLNIPTGSFFYDPWVIKPEFKDTVWEKLLAYIPTDIGEARVILLQPGHCYNSHADIDDRYHLNLTGNYSFLVDIDSQKMYKTVADGYWYSMDASPRHSAVNYGEAIRVQLVVRKLLLANVLADPIGVEISSDDSFTHSRYVFDDTISQWLNLATKRKILSNFEVLPGANTVRFKIEKNSLSELEKIIPPKFKLGIL